MFFHSLFMGMKGGDVVIESPVSSIDVSDEVVSPVTINSVFSELLQGEETQRTKEFVDRNYRILLESNKYHLKLKKSMTGEEAFDCIFNEGDRILEKYESSAIPCSGVYKDSENYQTVVVQDAPTDSMQEDVDIKTGVKVGSSNAVVALKTDLESCIYKIEREGFTPKIFIEPYIKRVAVKKITDSTSRLELYVSKYPRQFYTRDNFLLAEIRKTEHEVTCLILIHSVL